MFPKFIHGKNIIAMEMLKIKFASTIVNGAYHFVLDNFNDLLLRFLRRIPYDITELQYRSDIDVEKFHEDCVIIEIDSFPGNKSEDGICLGPILK